MPEVKGKPFWKSRTLWLNVATLGVWGAKRALDISTIPEPDPMLLALANLVLRVITKQPIGLSGRT